MTQAWQDATALRIYLHAGDQADGENAADALLRVAREAGLAGGTVLAGTAGFGATGTLHRASLLGGAKSLPLVVEFVDDPERIDAFLSTVQRLLESRALVTLTRLQILPRVTPGQ